MFESIRHVEVTARAHTNGDWNVRQILGGNDRRVRAHVDRPARHAVRVGHELAQTGPGVAHAAPGAVIDDVNRLGVAEERRVLGSLQVLLALPAGHDARDYVPAYD